VKKRKREELDLAKPPSTKKRRTSTSLEKKLDFINAHKRAAMLRKMLGLQEDVPEDKARVLSDSKREKVKCCGKWLRNKSDSIRSHLDSNLHKRNFESYLIVKQQEGRGTLDGHVVVVPPSAPSGLGAPTLDPETVLVRENFVRSTIIAGIPINAMDEMRQFNSAHFDFSVVRMSDMADTAFPLILTKEILKIRDELERAGSCVLGFDGTTHYGEESFFVVRYVLNRKLFVKCIAAKHADKSMDSPTLCKLFKKVCDVAGIKYADNSTNKGNFCFN
jgi:hypothetical protein